MSFQHYCVEEMSLSMHSAKNRCALHEHVLRECLLKQYKSPALLLQVWFWGRT